VESAGHGARQLIVFALGAETYGIDINSVSEIGEMRTITPVPGSPDFVMGILNLRGNILPVIDLRRRLLAIPAPVTPDPRIIVIEVLGQQLGIVADSVSEVLTVSKEDVLAPSRLITGPDVRFIDGIVRAEQRLIILLNLGMVLSEDETRELLNAV
jgi:purine-binding chemotaxis protein CheW